MFIMMYMYMVGMMTLCFNRKHIFLCLLSLEFIVLSLFLMIGLYMSLFSYENYFLMIFLTFSVCEGAIGLSVLVYLIRSHGNDYMKSFSMILC